MRVAASLICLAALISCGRSGDGDSAEVSDVQLTAYAYQEVSAMLRDPSSAEFSDARVSRKAGVPAVCGWVNSNNGFGGKSGRQRFISGGATVIEEQMATGEMDQAWARLC